MNATTNMSKKYISSYDEYLFEMTNAFMEIVKNVPDMVPDIMQKVEEIKFLWNLNDASNVILFTAASMLMIVEKACDPKIYENAIDSIIDSIDNEHFVGDEEYREVLRHLYSTLNNEYHFHFGERYRMDYVPKF